MSKHTPHSAFAPVAEAPTPDLAALHPEPQPEPGTALAVTEPDEDDAPEPYDPADYRWVPVRRRPRFDGWTEEKQRRFIETLADTGLVNVAASAVGMSRASAYQLRRSPHGAAFARAWDAAREHAGGLVEDIAFERAIEGTEQEVLNRYGEVVATRLVHDNRLLKYLLSHLKPERYGARLSDPHPAAASAPASAQAVPALHDSLCAMEPALPAPPEQLLDPETLAGELHLADVADGVLPHFLREQRPPKSAARIKAEEAAARDARGAAAWAKEQAGVTLTEKEFADACFHLDPLGNARPRPRRRQGADSVKLV
ncbi:hypothetical protein [Sphingomonas sp. MS122]|uniref:hypothetical protein n=1 Tax=Sphingomonas sp. MS122 TaxID=3412683 RepID=UPI003C2F6D7A